MAAEINESTEFSDEEMDSLLDELGMGNQDPQNPDQPMTGREALTNVATGALDEVTRKENLAKYAAIITKQALPKGYQTAIETGESIYNEASSLYDKAVDELKEPFDALKNTINQSVDAFKFLPEGIRDRIKSATEVAEDDYPSYRTEYNPDQAALQGTMAAIFQQNKDQAKLEADASQSEAVANLTLQQAGLKANQSSSSEMIRQLTKLTSYQDSIGIEYQKKSLELQYLHYFAARDLLKSFRASQEDNKSWMQAIVHNTALPDFMKIRLMEGYQQKALDNVFGSINENVGEYLSKYTDRWKENIRNRASELIGKAGSGMMMGGDAVAGIASAMQTGDGLPEDVQAQMAGSMAGDFAAEQLSKHVGNKLRRYLQKNRLLSKHSDKLMYFFENNAQFINKALEDWDGRLLPGSITDKWPFLRIANAEWLARELRTLNPGMEDQSLSLAQNLRKEALTAMPFDNITRRSIVEIIPGLLSRQLEQLTILNGGKPGRQVFSTRLEKFVDQGEEAKAVDQDLFENSARRRTRTTDAMLKLVDKVSLNRLDANEDDVRQAFTTAMVKASQEGKLFSLDTLKNLEYGDEKTTSRIQEVLDGIKGDTTKFELIGARVFRQIADSQKDMQEKINKLYATGETELLDRMGILKEERGQTVVDNDEVMRRLSQRGGYKYRGDTPPNEPPPVTPVPPTTPPAPAAAPAPANASPVFSRAGRVVHRGGERPAPAPDRVRRSSPAREAADVRKRTQRISRVMSQPVTGINPTEHLQTLQVLSSAGVDLSDTRSRSVIRNAQTNWDRQSDRLRTVELAEVRKRMLREKATDEARKNKEAGIKPVMPEPTKPAQPAFETAAPVVDITPLLRAMETLPDNLVGRIRGTDKEPAFGIERNKVWGVPVHIVATNKEASNDPENKTRNIFNLVEEGFAGVWGRLDVIAKGQAEKKGSRVGGLIHSTLTGAGNFTSAYFRGASGLFGTLANITGKTIMGAGRMVGLGGGVLDTDVYVEGQKAPALRAKVLKEGGYRDKETGKVIRSIKDIKGDVIDADGNVVLTAAEIERGVYTHKGKNISGLFNLLASPFKMAMNFHNRLFNLPVNILRAVTGADRKKKARDVFVKGERSPRLLARIMERGGYFSRTKKRPIYHHEDIDGEILDADGQVILSHDDIRKGITDWMGVPIGGSLLKAAVVGTAKAAFKFAKLNVDVGLAPFKMIKRLGERRAERKALKAEKNTVADTESTTAKIYQYLQMRFPLGEASPDDLQAVMEKQNKLLQDMDAREKARAAAAARPAPSNDADKDGMRDNSWQARRKAKEAAKKGQVEAPKEPKVAKEEKKDGFSWVSLLLPLVGGIGTALATGFNLVAGAVGGVVAGIGGVIGGLSAVGGMIVSAVTGLGGLIWKGVEFLGKAIAAKRATDAIGDIADDMDVDGPDGKKKGRGRGPKGRGAGKKGLFKRGLTKAAELGSKAKGGLGRAATKVVAKGAAARAGAAVVGEAAAGMVGRVATGAALRMGASAAGAAVIGTAAAPVIAVAGLAYTAYQVYDYFSSRSAPGPLEALRFLQYGIPLDNDDLLAAVRELESNVDDEVSWNNETPTMQMTVSEATEEWAEDFGIDLASETQQISWATWFAKRFMPIYLTHAAAARKLKVDLEDVDGDLESKQIGEFVRAVNLRASYRGKEDPLTVLASPMPGIAIGANEVAIRELTAQLLGNNVQAAPLDKAPEFKSQATRKGDEAKKADGKVVDVSTDEEKMMNLTPPGATNMTVSPKVAQLGKDMPIKAAPVAPTVAPATPVPSVVPAAATAPAAATVAAPTTATSTGRSVTYIMPTQGRISSPYGPRIHPISHKQTFHKGVDIAAPTGTPIVAAAEGRIYRRYYSETYGNVIYIAHPDGKATRYAHQSQFASGLAEGSMVAQGQLIGYVGNTGASRGAHLHFEVRVTTDAFARTLNPMDVLSGKHFQIASNELDSTVQQYKAEQNGTYQDNSIEGLDTTVSGMMQRAGQGNQPTSEMGPGAGVVRPYGNVLFDESQSGGSALDMRSDNAGQVVGGAVPGQRRDVTEEQGYNSPYVQPDVVVTNGNEAFAYKQAVDNGRRQPTQNARGSGYQPQYMPQAPTSPAAPARVQQSGPQSVREYSRQQMQNVEDAAIEQRRQLILGQDKMYQCLERIFGTLQAIQSQQRAPTAAPVVPPKPTRINPVVDVSK